MSSAGAAPYGGCPLTSSVSAADFAFLIAESDSIDWGLTAGLVVGAIASYLGVRIATRHERRIAHDQAAELLEVARREAAVAAEELKQKTEVDLQESAPN